MKLIITPVAHLKLQNYTQLTKYEISGMAKSTIDEDKNIIVTDVIIFKQECSAANTEIDDEAQAKFLNELMQKEERTEDWNIWWHSHCDMGVFWSTTDDATIKNHINGQSYLISLVVNKADDCKARLDIFPKDLSPFKEQTFCTYDLDIEIQLNKEAEKQKKRLTKIIDTANKELKKVENIKNPLVQKQCIKEIKEKVTITETALTDWNQNKKWNKQWTGQVEDKIAKWRWWEDDNEGDTPELDYSKF